MKQKLLVLLLSFIYATCFAISLSACNSSGNNDFEYTLSYDRESYIVSGIGECTDTDIVIPATHNGLPVTAIGNSAFSNYITIESITIPECVTTIGNNAFYNTAYYNDSNNWDNNVLYIGNYLIEADTSISGNYEINDGTTVIADGAFSYCTNLTSVTIPDSVITIGDDAFSYCTWITNVAIGNSVKTIGDNAFFRCYQITNITMPASITSISYGAFTSCSLLKSITFENPNNWYITDRIGFTNGTIVDVTNADQNAEYLTDTYRLYYWYRSE